MIRGQVQSESVYFQYDFSAVQSVARQSYKHWNPDIRSLREDDARIPGGCLPRGPVVNNSCRTRLRRLLGRRCVARALPSLERTSETNLLRDWESPEDL